MSYSGLIQATPGLVSYWKLAEPSGNFVALDSFGPNPGAYNFGVTLGVIPPTPQLVSAMSCNGGGVADIPAFATGTTISLEFWLQLAPGQQNGLMAIIARPPLPDNWYLMIFSGNLYFNVQSTGIFFYTMPPGFDGNWHHIVVTQTGTSAVIYIDGVAVVTGTNTMLATGHDVVGVNDLCFGSGNGQWPMDAALAAVALYNTVLDAPTVLAHYNAAFAPLDVLTNNAAMLMIL